MEKYGEDRLDIVYLLIHGKIKRVKPTPKEIAQWQSEHMEGLPIAGGPSTPSWKRYSTEDFSIPFFALIDPADMKITALGSAVTEEALDALLNE